ncbi:MAG TPA: hypothetical protein VHG10_01470 [Glycomyces sp.]|nr:hypothetical protein [Glycomyces sp.]
MKPKHIKLTYDEYVAICQELRAAAALHRETAAKLTSYELAMKFVARAKQAEALAQAVASRYFGVDA